MRKICQLTPNKPLPAHLTEDQLKRGVRDGSISLVVWDTACISNTETNGDPLIQSDHSSTKVFELVDVPSTLATNISKL